MKALLRKDIYIIASQFKLLLVMILVFCAVPGGRLVPFAVLYSVLMPSVTLMSIDEQSRWDSLALMLPYSRGEIVTEKYIIGWLSLVFTLLLSAGFQTLWHFAFPADSVGPETLDPGHLSLLCVYAAMALVFQAVSCPINFRLGFAKGRIVSLISLGAAGGVIGSVYVASPLEKAFDTVAFLSSHLHIATYPLLAAALSVASVPLAVKGYKKRVEK